MQQDTLCAAPADNPWPEIPPKQPEEPKEPENPWPDIPPKEPEEPDDSED